MEASREKRVEDLRKLGVPEAQIDEMLEPQEVAGFQVWPCNWQVLQAFLICATQWHFVSGLQVARIGLDYAGCESALRLAKMALSREEFDDLQFMETEIITNG